MAAPQSEGEAQKLRFGPWLVNAVSSGRYQGLRWIDPARKAFRIPWKHNARKDVTSSDLEVFKAWAQASGRYEDPEDPAKWKTNFRCALTSTRMFVLLEDHSKCGDDPHKVYAIAPGTHCRGEEGDFGSPDPVVDQQVQLNPQDIAPEIAPPGGTDPTQPSTMEDLEWVLKQCAISSHNLGPLNPSWIPSGETDTMGGRPQSFPTSDFSAEEARHRDTLLQPHPEPSQNNCIAPPTFQPWVPMAEQPLLATYSLPGPILLGEQGECCGAGSSPRCTSAVTEWEESGVLPCAPHAKATPHCTPLNHNADAACLLPQGPCHHHVMCQSIYYRGRLFHQEEVVNRRCLLVYQPFDPAVAGCSGHLVRFPSPAELADCRQRHYTEELLAGVGLQLEQRACKLFATRLKKCKVFWALSRQLEGTEEPSPNLLCRDQETPIFDFNKFCTELRDFRNRQRKRSPDFTIYLCFGQSFCNAKPKESKLILVKLVPRFCEYWCEQVLREGASSLDSGTISLQLSDSFSLFELIEQYNMQMD
ncbi:interferon regulatory factor 7 [Columba livia]|uniref:Interferon regulatory factor 7 n=1 Tax=Columba livia TaxID=8932 RepID=A0A2I0MIC3_COLLI|nr:interferon regulatory factor 7 [Columba livia]